MIRTIQYAEKNVITLPPNVITIAATTATFVLRDSRVHKTEISQRFIQNTGANPLYFSEGVTDASGNASCDNLLNYHGYLAAGQQLDCSQHRQCVSVYSVLGTTVAVTVRHRYDMAHRISQS
jgi:hypothetical protein